MWDRMGKIDGATRTPIRGSPRRRVSRESKCQWEYSVNSYWLKKKVKGKVVSFQGEIA